MPKRSQQFREGSNESSSVMSESDIPWFGNFGKYVNNAAFLMSAAGIGSSESLLKNANYDVTTTPQETGSRMQSRKNSPFSQGPFSQARSSNNPPPPFAESIQEDQSIRRVSSGLIPPSRNAPISVSTSRNKDNSIFRKSNGSDEEERQTLGAKLRRMVSYDQYSRRNPSRAHEQQGPMRAFPRISRDRYSRMASRDVHDFSPNTSMEMLPQTEPLPDRAPVSNIGMVPPQSVQYSRNGIAGPSNLGRRADKRWDDEEEAAPKTLGAMLRRMVSFDHQSRRQLSTAHQDPTQGNTGRRFNKVSLQLPRTGARREPDVDSHVRSIRRW